MDAHDEQAIIDQINRLVEEEHALRGTNQLGGLDEAQRRRLGDLEARLDQCWDLLRQRRARREFGDDPATAEARDTSTVEHYQQ